MAETSSEHSVTFWRNRIAVSLGIGLLVVLFIQDAFFHFGFFERTSLAFIDRAFLRRGPVPVVKESLDVVIISISDRSETTVPERFPFPRSYYARAVRNLNRAGARAIGIDLTFEQPDVRGPHHDEALFDAIRQYRNVVVAGKTDLASDDATVNRTNENFHSIFYAADSSVGSVFVPNDADGVYRRYMPFAKMPGQERYIPSFAFALYAKALGLPSTTIGVESSEAFTVGPRPVPKYDDMSMLINYHGTAGKTFRDFDIVNVLDDSDFQTVEERELHTSINVFDDPNFGLLHDGTFRDKIVLIGPYFSESKDLFNVSMSDPDHPDRNLMYGVELHANALQTLLDQRFIRTLGRTAEVAIVLLLSVVLFVVVTALKNVRTRYGWLMELAAVAISGGAIAGSIALFYWAFAQHDHLLPVVPMIATVVLTYSGSAVTQYLSERRKKTMIKGMFSQYLNPSVVNELIAHPEKLRLGGEKKELTVFFSDIASFTNFSEKLDAVDLVAILNEYLSAMTEIILRHDGTLDKYVGDAVMAVWGAPIPLQDHALHACRAALEMQQKCREIAEKWAREGKPTLVVRMGLNTDMMVVGNVGGASRFDYTVIGDAVNLGSRLEGANKEYGTRIMVSERTANLVKNELLCRELDLLRVKGKTQPIRVYELVGARNSVGKEMQDKLAVYEAGLALYRERKFKQAIKEFLYALTLDPEDGPSQLYLLRSQTYAKKAPPKDWDGVFAMKTK